MNYLKKQLDIFVKSFRIPQTLKLCILEFAKCLSLSLLMILALAVFARLFQNVQPVMDILANMKATGITAVLANDFTSNHALFNGFVIKLITLVIITFILGILLFALFESMIMASIRKKQWNMRLYRRFIINNFIITLIFGIVGFILVYNLTNILLLTLLFALLMLIYAYFMLVFAVNIDEKRSYWNNLALCLKNTIKIHKSVIPLLIVLLVLFIMFILLSLLAMLLRSFILIIFIPAVILWLVWIKNYVYYAHTIN